MAKHSYKLSYFNARGGAELSRLVFKAAGVDFEDERLEGEAWQKRKPDMPLKAMPVLQIDGKTTFCQSAAIARYLAREFGLMGSSNLDAFRIEEVMEMFSEMLNRELMKIYMEKDENAKKELSQKFSDGALKTYLAFLEKRLSENDNGSGFLVGDKMTLGDLAILDGLSMLGNFGLDAFEGRPLLKTHKDKVEAIESIAKWLKERPETKF